MTAYNFITMNMECGPRSSEWGIMIFDVVLLYLKRDPMTFCNLEMHGALLLILFGIFHADTLFCVCSGEGELII